MSEFEHAQPPPGGRPVEIDPDRIAKTIRDCLKHIHENQAALVSQGFDVSEMLGKLGSAERNLNRLSQLRDELLEIRLQLIADLADLQYSLFKRAKSLTEEMSRTNPADPGLKDLKKMVGDASKHFPLDS